MGLRLKILASLSRNPALHRSSDNARLLCTELAGWSIQESPEGIRPPGFLLCSTRWYNLLECFKSS